jgi:hypothetical protein
VSCPTCKSASRTPCLDGNVVPNSGVKGPPICRQRKLSSWPVNDMWCEFLNRMDIHDSTGMNAAEQLECFYTAMSWPTTKDGLQQAGFMACLQLWNYGMPVEKM